MASNTGGDSTGMALHEKEVAIRNKSTQLLEDVDGRLDELQDMVQICDLLMNDLVELQGILADKNLGDKTVQCIKQGNNQ